MHYDYFYPIEIEAENTHEAHEEAEKRAYNKHIDELIAEKQEESLRNMTIEQLKSLKK